jgi:hypothetical protein
MSDENDITEELANINLVVDPIDIEDDWIMNICSDENEICQCDSGLVLQFLKSDKTQYDFKYIISNTSASMVYPNLTEVECSSTIFTYLAE